MNIQVDPTSFNLASAMLNSKIRPRAVVGYSIKIFHPSPPNYVTRSPGSPAIFIIDCSVILRQSAGDGVEIGSLLVPMVLTSQMAFIKRWGDKNLRVTGKTLELDLSTEALTI